ncbi:hypothetical protein [Povalibacter sp.]|uniref:hypothetical protein n=1 Tax=Povalibacter sp. TaxID=1962978 RepID=UPI002F3E4544
MAQRKRYSLILSLAGVALSSDLIAQSSLGVPTVEGFYTINLGFQPVTNYHMTGWPNRVAGRHYVAGDLLHGLNGGMDGQVLYDFYWQLTDGRIYAERVDVRKRLPGGFRGDVIFSIQDDHIELSWANENPAWRRASKKGDMDKVIALPAFDKCGGPFFDHPVMKDAWAVTVKNVNANPRVANVDSALSDLRCTMSSYFPKFSPKPSLTLEQQNARSRAMDEWSTITKDLMKRKVVESSDGAVQIR